MLRLVDVDVSHHSVIDCIDMVDTVIVNDGKRQETHML